MQWGYIYPFNHFFLHQFRFQKKNYPNSSVVANILFFSKWGPKLIMNFRMQRKYYHSLWYFRTELELKRLPINNVERFYDIFDPPPHCFLANPLKMFRVFFCESYACHMGPFINHVDKGGVEGLSNGHKYRLSGP